MKQLKGPEVKKNSYLYEFTLEIIAEWRAILEYHKPYIEYRKRVCDAGGYDWIPR